MNDKVQGNIISKILLGVPDQAEGGTDEMNVNTTATCVKIQISDLGLNSSGF